MCSYRVSNESTCLVEQDSQNIHNIQYSQVMVIYVFKIINYKTMQAKSIEEYVIYVNSADYHDK